MLSVHAVLGDATRGRPVLRSRSDYNFELPSTGYSVIAALSALRRLSGAKAYKRPKADILQCKDIVAQDFLREYEK